MAINNYPDTSGGAGQLVYSFIPVTGAEYATPLCVDSTQQYEIQVKFADPSTYNSVTLEIYTDANYTTPRTTQTVFADRPFVYAGPINRIKILTGAGKSSSTYIGSGGSTLGSATLTIRKWALVTPARTGYNNDGLGDVYVHVEPYADWAPVEGYGWQSPRLWVGWTYSYDGTGVYRIGRSNQQTNTFQYKAHTTRTWTNLANIPSEVQFGDNSRLTRAHIYDTQLITYVIFRCSNTQTHTVAGTSGTYNQYFAYYTKSSNTWTVLAGYNITTWGDPTHTYGPKMFFIASDASANQYLFHWQIERGGTNTFYRYHTTTGVRSLAGDQSIASWNQGAYIPNYGFVVSPTSNNFTVDGSATDYQIYNPSTNTWTALTPPSRSGEGTTWFRGGTVFRYNATAVGVIGRRTYNVNSAAPSNVDRYMGRRFFTYDLSTTTWTDRSASLGNFYPIIMRPSNATDRWPFQPVDASWNGRFYMFPDGESIYTSRGSHDYLNVMAPKRVDLIGQTGRPRGEMAVGATSVLAYGHMFGVEQQPFVYPSNAGFTMNAEAGNGFNTWGMELVYTDGTVKYGPNRFIPLNVIYDPTTHKYYCTGYEFAFSQWVASSNSVARLMRSSWVVDEKEGVFTKMDIDFYDTTGVSATWWYVSSAGLAYNSATHFMVPYGNTGVWTVSNILGGYNYDGWQSNFPNRAFTDYTWHPVVPGTDNQRTQKTLTVPSGTTAAYQVVQWGKGARNPYGIPEGTIFWNGQRLWQWALKDPQYPFISGQTGWRTIYTVSAVQPWTTYTYYGAMHVWRDENYAICQTSTQETYYVFDLNNLYTTEPQIISSHVPIEAMLAPSYNTGNAATIGSNGWRFMKNAANVGGVEIIYGQVENDGYRGVWTNDNIYIVRDYLPESTLTLDRNS